MSYLQTILKLKMNFIDKLKLPIDKQANSRYDTTITEDKEGRND